MKFHRSPIISTRQNSVAD